MSIKDALILKPGSHRNIAKDYRPKTGKDHDILRESVKSDKNCVKIAILIQFSKDSNQIHSRFLGLYLSLACNLIQSFCVNWASLLKDFWYQWTDMSRSALRRKLAGK